MSAVELNAREDSSDVGFHHEPLALLLVVLFGPVGLLYTSVRGGVALILVALVGSLFTMGFAPLAVWPVCIAWVLVATGLLMLGESLLKRLLAP